MRPIDAVSLSEGIELHRKSTDQEYEMDRQWAVGYNAGLDRALYSIAYAKTIAPPPNDPLTLEELRKMGGEPVWIHSFSSIQKKPRISGWAIVETVGSANATFVRAGVNCRTTKWFTNYGSTWLAYRRRPEEGTT